MKRTLLFLCMIFVAAGAPQARADLLYEQAPNADLLGHYANAEFAHAADNFVLGSDAIVSGALWYGFYRGVDLDSLPATMYFDVAFFSDAEGLPGDPLWQGTLSATVRGTALTITNPHPDYYGRKIYEFEAGLTPITVTGGVPMWLSVAEADTATPASGNTQWLWNFSTDWGDGSAIRSLGGGWVWREGGGDTAFTLSGQVVPLPGAVLLGAIGLACAGGLLRRGRAS